MRSAHFTPKSLQPHTGRGQTNPTRQKRGWLLHALLIALAAQAAHSAAPPPPETISAKVSLADLDLSTPAGIAAARLRIASTANRLCREFEDLRKSDHREARADCLRETMTAGLDRLRRQVQDQAPITPGGGTQVAKRANDK